MPALSNTLSLALLAGAASVSAMPTGLSYARRGGSLQTRDTTHKSTKEYMHEALTAALAIQNIDAGGFYALQGWTTVDFSSPNSASANNLVFLECDRLQNVVTGNGTAFFSTSYVNFVQDLSKAVENNQTDSSSYDDARDEQAKACGPDLVDAVGDALKTYISLGVGKPPANASDPALLEWAETEYAPYMDAHMKCQLATNNYNAESSRLFGDDVGIFSAAENNIAPLVNATGDHPGVTMTIGGSSAPSNSSGGNGTSSGAVVPYYSITVMNGTLGAWQQGAGLMPFSYDSSSDSSNSTSSSSSNSTSLKIVWEDSRPSIAGTNSSMNSTSSNSTSSSNSTFSASKFELSFASLSLMVIDRGVWFDGFRSAAALQNPPDDQAKKGVPVFQQYFGSKDKPGSAAVYNDQALVAYQPKITISFNDSASYNSFKKGHSEQGECLPFVCATATHDGSVNNTAFHDDNNTVVWKDESQKAYILGYTQTNFWDN